MVEAWAYAMASVVGVSLIAFIGVTSLALKEKQLKNVLIYLLSFSAGALFGDAFLHLLPEAVEESGFTASVSLSVIAGVVVFFVMEKLLHWHHYHLPHSKENFHAFAVMNLVGDALHNFIDGLIIGASYLTSIPLGIATTLAVAFHEIPQEIGDFGVLLKGGFSKWKAVFYNFLTALSAVLGAVIALYANTQAETLTMLLVPFAAGGFIYVAGTDLIPELHKEPQARSSVLQLAAFLLGVLAMYALLFLE